jgi:hypothetical protein
MARNNHTVPHPDDPKAWWNNLPKGKSGTGADVCPHGVPLKQSCAHCKHTKWREQHDPTFYDDVED